MIETGCRPGELRTLQWSEVRDDHFVILPANAKDREERKIPIMPALRKILDRRRKGPDGLDLSAESFVFGNETGDEMHRRHMCSLWTATCTRAKVKNLHLHDLRGEAGSQLLEAGVPIHEVRDALGHSSTTMTSTYLRTRSDSLARAFKQRDVYRARKSMRLAKSGQSNLKRKSS
jgi:integrase